MTDDKRKTWNGIVAIPNVALGNLIDQYFLSVSAERCQRIEI